MPYNSFLIFSPSDIQPISGLFVLLLFIIIFINNTIKIPKLILPLFILAIFSLFYNPFITQTSTPVLSNIRSLYGYIIGPITFIVFYNIRIVKYRKIIFIATAIIFLGTGLELVTKMLGLGTLFDILIDGIIRPRGSNIESVDYRGSSSIFPEPSFVAITLLFHILLYSLVDKRINKKYFFISIFPILATLSGSIIPIIFSIVFVLFINIFLSHRKKRNYKTIIFSVVLILLSYNISTNYLNKTRIGFIAKNIVENPTIILEDPSIFDRVFSVYFPFKILDKNILGSGTGSYSPNSVDNFISIYKNEDRIIRIAAGKKEYLNKNRLMSTIGNYLYDFGVIGLLCLFIFIFSSLFVLIKKESNKKLSVFIIIIILWFQAVPVPHPLPWIILSQVLGNK